MELSQTGAFSNWIERSGFELWLGSLHCVLRQHTKNTEKLLRPSGHKVLAGEGYL